MCDVCNLSRRPDSRQGNGLTHPGLPEGATHDYVRHGTTTLFAALEIATGQVTAACKPRHRHQEFLAFLKQVAKAYPGQELHLVMDNYAASKRVEVRDWLAANPRIHVHCTPTSGSWLDLVEVWFGIIQRQAIGRGTFTSVTDLTAKIRAFINGWNDHKHPFVWTKTPDQILAKANRQRTSNTGHWSLMSMRRKKTDARCFANTRLRMQVCLRHDETRPIVPRSSKYSRRSRSPNVISSLLHSVAPFSS